ncbi:MAG: GDSL-type esterase/lipase family protein [Bacteroidales bacterium]
MLTIRQSLSLILLLFTLSSFADVEKIKIACIGNSITFGAGIENREKNSYPAQLQQYMGEEYEIRNFGVSGSTILSKGDRPYTSTEMYRKSLEYCPDIVFIKLGTNDSKPQNIIHQEEIKADYGNIIRNYQNLPSRPRIILLTPVRCFATEIGIKDEVIQKQIRPVIESIAFENNLEIINLYNLFGNTFKAHLMPDKLHPSSIGAGLIAQHLYQYLTMPRDNTGNRLSAQLNTKTENFNFYGYKGYSFKLNGVSCRLVEPKTHATDAPWVLRARFWGHEPQADLMLLERGFHIAYCDVANLYGSPEAIKRWDAFYEQMITMGFSPKVVLEGMSRGGLVVYNWAVRNKDKVACIYADAPVMDIKSWPLGYEPAKKDVANLLKAYGFESEKQIQKWKKNPVDHARKIARANIPILHVVGDDDDVVPVAQNTALFEKQIKKAGGEITVIHKPGVKHHPHSLNNPEPIVRFILKSTGYHQNACIQPVCGNEFRSAAGWTKGAEWHQIAEDITATLSDRKIKLLLLGNSITQGFGGSRKLVTHKPGKQPMDQILGEGNWESAGISGDRTQNLLWRMQYGNYDQAQPENIIITIGVNNLGEPADDPEDVAAGIKAVSDICRIQFPKTRIILFGVLPAGENRQQKIRQSCEQIHKILAKENWEGIEYINPASWFVNDDGSLKQELFNADKLHLSPEGYKVWAGEIGKIIL